MHPPARARYCITQILKVSQNFSHLYFPHVTLKWDLSDQCDTITIPYISECIRVVIIFLHMSYLLSPNGCLDGIKVE